MASALGLALALTGFVVTARSAADTVGAVAGGSTQVVESYVVAPAVRLDAEEASRTVRSAPRAHAAMGTPRRLVIKALNVDVPVLPIDAPGGVLLPPSDPRSLGWWRDGAEAGAARGSVLIAGHTVSSGGGAFDNLETLTPGDRVRVRTTNGVVAYRVTGVTIYRKAAPARHSERLFSQSVPGRLVLVTCEDWNGSTYLSNAVALAEPLLSQ